MSFRHACRISFSIQNDVFLRTEFVYPICLAEWLFEALACVETMSRGSRPGSEVLPLRLHPELSTDWNLEVVEIDEPLLSDLDDSIESFLVSGIVQQVTRTQIAESDQIVGIFRCDFEPDQQRYALNIPIHPALSEIPSVEALCLESDARIRITDLKKFGVRLEVVLNENSQDAQSVFVDAVIVSKK